MHTGEGRCKRRDAIASPGDSNDIVGAPKVTPSSEANAPPNEWPITHMLEVGYIYVTLLYKFCNSSRLEDSRDY